MIRNLRFYQKPGRWAGAIGSEISLTRHLNQEDRIMMVKAEGSVQGYVERKGKENRVYRPMDLYVKDKYPGNLA